MLRTDKKEEGEGEGHDKKESDKEGNRPGSVNSTRSATSTKPTKPTPPSSPQGSRKAVSIPSSPKISSLDSPKAPASPLSKSNPSSTPTLPQIKNTLKNDTKKSDFEKSDGSTTPVRSNSFKSDTSSKSGNRTPDLVSYRSDASRTSRRRVVSGGHGDTIKRLHQTLLEMEKEKQGKIDFIIDSQDSAQESLRAAHLVGGLEEEKELRSARRHSSLSQKDQLRLAQLLNG